MNVSRPSAIRQFAGSERVIGAVLLLVVVGLTLLFPALFAEWQTEIMTILAALMVQFVGLHTYVKVSAGEIVFSEDPRRPLFEPLRKLWNSRKFMTTLIGLLLELVTMAVPLDDALKAQIMGTILLLVTLLNMALAMEDRAANKFFLDAATETQRRGV
jgi:uncharacterized membrane protein